jgi:hypothetical protein
VKVDDSKDLWQSEQSGAHHGEATDTLIRRRSEKEKGVARHIIVLFVQISLHNLSMASKEACFVEFRRSDDIHGFHLLSPGTAIKIVVSITVQLCHNVNELFSASER